MAQALPIDNIDVVSLTLKVGGNAIKSTYHVLSIDVTREVNRVATAKIVLVLERGQAANEAFEPSESDDFLPGKDVEIQVGYHSDDKTIFKGIIVNHSLKARPDRRAQLILHCSDKAVKMTLGRKNKYFKDMLDSALISSIISEYGLEKQVEASTYQHKQLIQYHAIDWDFIIARAEANGMIVYTEDGKVFVKKPLSSGSAELEINYDRDVFEFDAEIETRFQIPSAVAHSWDMKKQAVTEGKSTTPAVNSQGNLTGKKLSEVMNLKEYELHTTGPVEAAELKEWSNAALLKSTLARMNGRVSFFGNATPKLNTLITLAGFGARFNGDALITRIQHTVSEGAWVTEIGFGLSPQWHAAADAVSAPPAGGLLPAIHGLQNATVKKIDADPGGESRIQVEVPMIAPSGDGIWARMANFYATGQKGSFFLPEIGDEVVVGFLNDDPRYAVILGSLYSSKLKPPYTAGADNPIKAIVTKNDLKLEFNDKDKVLTIQTPAGNKFILSDKDKNITLQDQNGNKMEMAAAGITMKSAKDIILQATGKVDIKANQDISAKASGGDVSLQGLNINAKANIAFSAQGSASAELKAAGNTTVKGAIVMIN